jgi:hypothetical protein
MINNHELADMSINSLLEKLVGTNSSYNKDSKKLPDGNIIAKVVSNGNDSVKKNTEEKMKNLFDKNFKSEDEYNEIKRKNTRKAFNTLIYVDIKDTIKYAAIMLNSMNRNMKEAYGYDFLKLLMKALNQYSSVYYEANKHKKLSKSDEAMETMRDIENYICIFDFINAAPKSHVIELTKRIGCVLGQIYSFRNSIKAEIEKENNIAKKIEG